MEEPIFSSMMISPFGFRPIISIFLHAALSCVHHTTTMKNKTKVQISALQHSGNPLNLAHS